MTNTIAQPPLPVAHPSLKLADLKPELHPSRSPNLFRWMRRRAHFYRDGGVADGVWRVKAGSEAAKWLGEGTLMIGCPMAQYPGDTDFSGLRLIEVLCNGSKAGSYCYASLAPQLEEVIGFWDRYMSVGRCAIDEAHSQNFIGDEGRYRIEGDSRTCLWCGAQQTRVITPRIVEDEAWVQAWGAGLNGKGSSHNA